MALPLLLAGCGFFFNDVASDYFVVIFTPNGTTLTDEGRLALRNAVADAQRSDVTRIAIGGYTNPATADAAADQVVQQRIALVQQALQQGGADPALIRRIDQRVGEQGFSSLRDGVTIQVQIGASAAPEPSEDENAAPAPATASPAAAPEGQSPAPGSTPAAPEPAQPPPADKPAT